jgi:hypothetical protein
MPLRDHFRSPIDDETSWDGLHGGWPMKIVEALGPRLPEPYVAMPFVHLGSSIEVDVGAFDRGGGGRVPPSTGPEEGGGVATAVWAPPAPTFRAAVDGSGADSYEVRVYDVRRGRRLVAAVELVSPSNKDRPEHRRAFVTKCAGLLLGGVCVAIVDIVTTRGADLYGEVLEHLGTADPMLSSGGGRSPLLASSCRWTSEGEGRGLEAWAYALEVGRPLPTLPLWLSPDRAVPLELEASYEETCRVLRIA